MLEQSKTVGEYFPDEHSVLGLADKLAQEHKQSENHMVRLLNDMGVEVPITDRDQDTINRIKEMPGTEAVMTVGGLKRVFDEMRAEERHRAFQKNIRSLLVGIGIGTAIMMGFQQCKDMTAEQRAKRLISNTPTALASVK